MIDTVPPSPPDESPSLRGLRRGVVRPLPPCLGGGGWHYCILMPLKVNLNCCLRGSLLHPVYKALCYCHLIILKCHRMMLLSNCFAMMPSHLVSLCFSFTWILYAQSYFLYRHICLLSKHVFCDIFIHTGNSWKTLTKSLTLLHIAD